MTIEQTIEISASQGLTLDMPRETEAAAPDDYVCPTCGKKEHIPNAVTAAAIREGRAMARGEIPVTWYNSVDEMWEALEL
jgi:hypothetical protein